MARRIGGAIGIVALIAAIAAPDTAVGTDGLVWCHDAARDLVTRRAAEACRGRIIDDAAAERVRTRREERIRRNFGGVRNAVPGRRRSGSGTGFFIASDGALVTNAHVVARCQAVTADAADGASGPARVLGIDAENDLALLRAEIVPPAVAQFRRQRDPVVDEAVAVVGFPLHGRIAIRPVLVTGHVLAAPATRANGTIRFRIRAGVRRGNSGGPVLDGRGRIIGIMAAKVHTPKTYQRTGRIVRDVGVAIPTETVFDFLDDHDQPFRRVADAAPLSNQEIMARARLFVARLVCWK